MGGPWALFTMTIERRFTLLGSVNARQASAFAFGHWRLRKFGRSESVSWERAGRYISSSPTTLPLFRLATRKELESRLFRGTLEVLVYRSFRSYVD